MLKVNGTGVSDLKILRRLLSGNGTHDVLILRGQEEKVIQFNK